jgi:hypothetical protein
MDTKRSSQTKRGLTVDQSKVRPKLTKEQRLTMTPDEKRIYHQERLREYRSEYNLMYAKATYVAERIRRIEEQQTALQFYRDYKATQALIEVSN